MFRMNTFREFQPKTVNIDDLIPRVHLLREINETIDFSLIAEPSLCLIQGDCQSQRAMPPDCRSPKPSKNGLALEERKRLCDPIHSVYFPKTCNPWLFSQEKVPGVCQQSHAS
ncbi:hypothetical protein [Polycladomyces subterraneus]|uniref:Uncharacterized protein n=1 Tax=Polycladomyces subterraneus TaxID=1016997 RepID=A0ABT8IR14_9BACL|nr:hypothetical protein [Polycladomyces subterraneus]MDN4595239.1 hypothetical protein [Polycladomyces subterraneus]